MVLGALGLMLMVLGLGAPGSAEAREKPEKEAEKAAKRKTHGPDRKDQLEAQSHGGSVGPGAPQRDVACNGQATTSPNGYRFVAVYTHLAGTPHDFWAKAGSIQSIVKRMNAVVAEESWDTGWVIGDLRFACNTDGSPWVGYFTSTGSDFTSITSSARAAGYNSSNEKYVILADFDSGTACGQATVYEDDRASVENFNNMGPDWGVSWAQCWNGRAPLHELAHSLGAVQRTAANSSGGFHCNDGSDVMCYADGGPTAAYNPNVCGDKMHFDCNHDDYFHAGSNVPAYLATHWNLGSRGLTCRWIRYTTWDGRNLC